MNSDRFAKILFYSTSLVTGVSLVFVFGMWSGYHQTSLFRFTAAIKNSIVQGASDIEETSFLRPDHLIQPARYDGSGVIVNAVEDRGELVLLSGFFGEDSEIRLLRRDGSVVKRWPLRFSEIFEDQNFLDAPPATDWNVDTHGALALPDGSIVFNFDYSGSAKIDVCGDVVWTMGHQTHHSIERAEGGGFWIPGQDVVQTGETAFPPFLPPYAENLILRVSESGEILHSISAPGLFYKNGLEALLSSAAVYFGARPADSWNREIVHLNKIDELTSDLAPDFPMFKTGDLLLSLRNLNMVLVVSPDTEEIKWWRIGPWIRQHDAEFRAGGTIAVFNNNIYLQTAFQSDEDRTTKTTSLGIPRVSNIIEVDPHTGVSTILYGGRADQELLSVTRGKVEMTDGQGLLITEFDGGRIIETDIDGNVVWEYINRYDSDEVSEITEARVYPRDYFTRDTWDCPQ